MTLKAKVSADRTDRDHRRGSDPVVEAAWLYHIDGLNQSAVADRMGVSRATIVNWLQEARERGLIRISLSAEAFTTHRLALALCERFGLASAYIVPDENLPPDVIAARVAVGAADWLPGLLLAGDRLGVSWGKSVHDLATAIHPTTIASLTVVQLVGSMATPYGFSSDACVSVITSRLGGRSTGLHAPAILSQPEVAQMLIREPLIAAQLREIAMCNAAVYAAGSCKANSHIIGSGLATLEDLAWYVARGAVGVICGRFIDVKGRHIAGPLDARMIGALPEALRDLRMSLVVCSDTARVDATRAALCGGLATHLITHAAAAEQLLLPEGVPRNV